PRTTGRRVSSTVAGKAGNRPAGTMLDLAAQLPSLEHIVVVGEGTPPGALSFDRDFLAGAGGAPAGLAGRELPPDEPFLILFTSGTTGDPKGALHSQNTLYAGIRGYAGALGLDETLVKASPHTCMHYVGFVQKLLAPLVLGGTAVLPGVWDPALYLEEFERHGVTMYYAFSGWVSQLLAEQQARPRDISALRHIVSGSAPVPPQLVEQVRRT